MAVSCCVRAEATLGEGPLWDPGRGRLYWFDIQNKSVSWWRPGNSESGHWTLPVRASAGAMRTDGSLLLASEAGIGVLDPATGALDIRLIPDEPAGNRSNDGGVDRQGRFWWGTMRDGAVADAGSVYRLDPDWTAHRTIQPITIPNALATSPDGRTFYVAESDRGVIWAYALDPDTGALGDRQLFAKVEDGSPDGAAVDAEGFLWNAHWGAWRVVRYAPDGRIDRVVEVPVEQPSSCAFGGEDLRTLFITSAREELSEEALKDQPLAGSLFSLEVEVPGLPVPPFAG